MVVLLPGILAMLLHPRYRRQLVKLLIPVALALALASATPLGATFISRTTEVQQANSSTSLRLVQPYLRLLPPATDSVEDLLLGTAPAPPTSTTSRTCPRGGRRTADAVLPQGPLRVRRLRGPADQRLPAADLLRRSTRRPPWLVGLLLVYLLVNAALLQPTLAYLAILFLGLLRPPDPHGPARWRRGAVRGALGSGLSRSGAGADQAGIGSVRPSRTTAVQSGSGRWTACRRH
jgi:hypothetical protein